MITKKTEQTRNILIPNSELERIFARLNYLDGQTINGKEVEIREAVRNFFPQTNQSKKRFITNQNIFETIDILLSELEKRVDS